MPYTEADCPNPSVHGNPFRYCPQCDWREPIPENAESVPYSTEQLARIIAFFADLHLARRFPLPDDVSDCCEWAREYLEAQLDGPVLPTEFEGRCPKRGVALDPEGHHLYATECALIDGADDAI
jgi:hypothetical protein